MEIASKLFGQAQTLSATVGKQGLAFVRVHPLSTTLFAGAVGTALYTANVYRNQQWAERMLGKPGHLGHVKTAQSALNVIQQKLSELVAANNAGEYKLKDNVTFTQLQALLAKIGTDGNQWTVPDAELSSLLAPVYKSRDEAIKAVEGKIDALKVAEIKAELVKVAADFIIKLKNIPGLDGEAAVLVMERVKKKLENTKTLDQAKANLAFLKDALKGDIEKHEGFKDTKSFTAAMKELLNTQVGATNTDTLQAFVTDELEKKLKTSVGGKVEAATEANKPKEADKLILNKLMLALKQALAADTGTLTEVGKTAVNLAKPVSTKLCGAIIALVSAGALVSLANRLPGLQDVLKKHPWIA